jgi:hypothetical protein
MSRSKVKEKKLNYYQRWRMRHKPVTIYLSLEEYEALKQVADMTGFSYRELLYNAARNVKEFLDDVVRSEFVGSVYKQNFELSKKLAEMKWMYERRAEAEYRRGFVDGVNRALDIVFKKCIIRCPNEVLEELQRLSVNGDQASSDLGDDQASRARALAMFEKLVRGELRDLGHDSTNR